MNCKSLKTKALMLYKNLRNINECKIKISFYNKFGCELEPKNIEVFNQNVLHFIFDDYKIIGQLIDHNNRIYFYYDDFGVINKYYEIKTLEDLGKYIYWQENER